MIVTKFRLGIGAFEVENEMRKSSVLEKGNYPLKECCYRGIYSLNKILVVFNVLESFFVSPS